MVNKTISELLNEIEETDERMNKLMQSLGYKDIIEAGEEAEEILKIKKRLGKAKVKNDDYER